MQTDCIHQPEEEENPGVATTRGKKQLTLDACFGLSLDSISNSSSGAIEANGDQLINKPDNWT